MNWRFSRDRVKAREWQERISCGRIAKEMAAFEAHTRSSGEDGRILIARAFNHRDEPYWAGLDLEELLAEHAWVSGATGSGKTYWIIGQIIQVIRDHRDTPIIVTDMKGELSEMLIEIVLPAVAHLHVDLPDKLRVIRPFKCDYLPALRVTAPEEGVTKEVQSFNLSATLAEALAEDLGSRMNRVFLRMASLAVELDAPLTDVKNWLENQSAFAAAGQHSRDPALRAYATQHFRKESQSAIQSLLARLDTFFLMEATRNALAAPTCVSLNEALESGITIIDLGEPPAGAETVSTFWSGILLGRLIRAIMNRPNRGPKCWCIFEEFQETLRKHQSRAFGRVLALARYKNVSLWFSNQQPAQIAAIEPTLVKLLRTNVGLMATFRSNIEDARTFAHALPLPDGKKESEYRTELLNGMTRLKRREMYLWLKASPFRAQLVRSPRLELDQMTEQAESLSSELREQIRKGIAALRPEEIENPVDLGATDPGATNLDEFLAPSTEELG